MSRDLRQIDRLRSAIGCRFRVKPEFVAQQDLSREGLLDFALWSGNPDPRYIPTATDDGEPRPVEPPPTWLTGIITPYLGAQALYSGRAADRIEYLDRAPIPPETAAEPPFLWLDNLRAFLAGIGFDYLASPTVGEELTAEGEVTRVDVRRSDRFGEFAVVYAELTYRDPRGQALAVGRGSAILYDVGNVATAPTRPRNPSASAVGSDVANAVATASSRPGGSSDSDDRAIVSWGDVSVGDTVPLFHRGPLNPAEIAAFFVKTGQSAAADEEISYARALLATGDFPEAQRVYRAVAVNPEYDFGLPRHTDDTKAKSEGAPGAYDVGLQRAAWIAQGITERLGEHAVLHSIWVEIRGFVVVGDVTVGTAEVVETWTEGGRRRFRLRIDVINQRGRSVAIGEAVVGLRAVEGASNADR